MTRLQKLPYSRWSKYEHKRLSQQLVHSYFDGVTNFTEEDEMVEVDGCVCRGECLRHACEGTTRNRNCGAEVTARLHCRNCYNVKMRNNSLEARTSKVAEKKLERLRRKLKKEEDKQKALQEKDRKVKKDMKREKKKKNKKKNKKNKKKQEEEEKNEEELNDSQSTEED